MSADVASRAVEERKISRKSSPAPSAEGLRPQLAGTVTSPVSSSTSTTPMGPPVTVPSVVPPPAAGARPPVP